MFFTIMRSSAVLLAVIFVCGLAYLKHDNQVNRYGVVMPEGSRSLGDSAYASGRFR
jgi:hypothetical protein